MQNFVLRMLAVTGALTGFVACGGTEANTDDSTVECSDEEYQAPVAGGGAGGGPTAECEMPSEPQSAIEIAGSYEDQFGSTIEITTTGWDFGYGLYTFSIVNNDENYAIARNAESDAFNPCAFSTFVWHEEEGGLYYCQSVFAATSECGAVDAARPDPTDLNGGCGAAPWSQLTAN